MLKKLFQNWLRKKEKEVTDKILEQRVDKVLLGFYGEEKLARLKAFELPLKSKRTTFKELSFETFNWLKVEEDLEENLIIWNCEDYPIGISLNYFDLVPDLPQEKSIDAIREMYLGYGVNILKSEFYEVEGLVCVDNVFKSLHERVVQYNANITIPFEDCSFVIKVISEDYGDTSLREAVLLPLITDDISDETNRTIYPYDETIIGSMNVAEKEEYDELMPFHHLTILREVMPKLLKSIKFEGTLKKRNPFYK